MIKYGYHRTSPSAVASIIENGFRPGYGDMYGKGWYMCYDIESQLKSDMTGYGSALIKAKILEKNVLIFDYNLSKQYYGAKYTLIDQLLANKFYKFKTEIPDPYLEMSDACELSFVDPAFSATIAYNCFVLREKGSAILKNKNLSGGSGVNWKIANGSVGLDNNKMPRIKKLAGIIFTGNHDGSVYVCYDPKSAEPVEYAITDRTEKKESDIQWKSVKEFDNKTVVANKSVTEIIYNRFRDISNCVIDPTYFKNEFNSDVELLIERYSWLFKATKRNFSFFIDLNGEVNATGGVWVYGDWIGKSMKGVTFKGGTFRGIFEKGEWINGIFEDGVMTDSKFYKGTFKSGDFIDSVFLGGRWEAPPQRFIDGSSWVSGDVVLNKKTYSIRGNKLSKASLQDLLAEKGLI